MFFILYLADIVVLFSSLDIYVNICKTSIQLSSDLNAYICKSVIKLFHCIKKLFAAIKETDWSILCIVFLSNFYLFWECKNNVSLKANTFGIFFLIYINSFVSL